jgi:hypothetical protein
VKTAEQRDAGQAGQFGPLFLALAEELKLPLQYIARQAELQQLGGVELPASFLQDIQASADMTVQLLDSYLLSLRLSLEPVSRLSLEPVSVSAVLYDTAAQLQTVAQQYGVQLDLHVQGRYEPVMAHRRALQSALVSLGYALIEALPAAGVEPRKRRMRLATHRTKQGIVAGMYGELDSLTPQLFHRAKQLQGQARQPLVGALPGSGAGVFVADALLGAMASRLRVGRFQRFPGFAVTLPASEQLQLV